MRVLQSSFCVGGWGGLWKSGVRSDSRLTVQFGAPTYYYEKHAHVWSQLFCIGQGGGGFTVSVPLFCCLPHTQGYPLHTKILLVSIFCFWEINIRGKRICGQVEHSCVVASACLVLSFAGLVISRELVLLCAAAANHLSGAVS